MAFWPAKGSFDVQEAGIASAFSRGDLLCYSGSSISRLDAGATIADIAGVALADSTQSVNNKATYAVPGFDGVFWADVNAGSAQTKGALSAVSYTAALGHHVLSTGTTTNKVVVERAIADIEGQSVQSRVMVRFISNAGDLAHS